MPHKAPSAGGTFAGDHRAVAGPQESESLLWRLDIIRTTRGEALLS